MEKPRLRGERALIARIGRTIGETPPGAMRAESAVPFGDDMAAIVGDSDLLWTVDMLMDGVDFDSSCHSWRDIGWKALAVNLSDCAAMAVKPIAALCAVSLSDTLTQSDAEAILSGIQECGERYGCRLKGGDTNAWKQPTVISMTVAGRVEAGQRPVLRNGARPGNVVFVSGPVGGSILGRHLRPTPRVELALTLNRAGIAQAMIDVSDGLSLDLWRICEASGCGAVLDEAKLQSAIHPDARVVAKTSGKSALEHALGDGEDFELIVAVDQRAMKQCGELGLIPIGQIVAESGLWLEKGGERQALTPQGWEHFR